MQSINKLYVYVHSSEIRYGRVGAEKCRQKWKQRDFRLLKHGLLGSEDVCNPTSFTLQKKQT